MKKIFTPAFFFALFVNSFAQKKCATEEYYNFHLQKNPALEMVKEQIETNAKNWTSSKNGNLLITVPVVFHVVYNVDSQQQNIPDSSIISQIEVLNEDFRKLNSDISTVRSVFDSITADVEIEFCLASVDPNGNSTNGITRTPTSKTSFEFFNNEQDDMKFTATGGEDAWSKESYLNIWTCYMTIFYSPGVLGYSHFPWDTSSATDGVVLLYNTVGRYNKVFDMPQGKGRTATHEVGHWFGLYHTWGNDGFLGGCDSSDYVEDTPNQNTQSNFDCNKTINSCSAESPFWSGQNPPDMVENYMDYSSDTCMCMYSEGQKERMLSFLNTARISLFNSTACGIDAVEEKSNNDENFKMFPNPNNGKFEIRNWKFGKNLPDGNQVEIYNLLGETIYTLTPTLLFKERGEGERKIDISQYPKGMYFVKVIDKENVYVKKIIYQ